MFLMSAMIGSRLIVIVSAQTRLPGVSPGDWAQYNETYSGNTMPPANLLVKWANVVVLGVSGENVTSETVSHYEDGHENTSIYVVNVDTGQGNGTGNFIAANLTEGSLIYTSPPSLVLSNFTGATINATIFRMYPIGNLTVNYLNTTITYGLLAGETLSQSYYWLKTTGIMTEYSNYLLIQTPSSRTWFYAHMEVTNAGSGGAIPEFSPALILPLFMIATIAAVFLGKTIVSTKKLTECHVNFLTLHS
jgi:hypothetical protein